MAAAAKKAAPAAKKAAAASKPPENKPAKAKDKTLTVDTVWVRPEDGGVDMAVFHKGDSVPSWAAEQMGDHCFADPDDDA